MPVHPRELLRFAGTDQLTTEALAAPASDEFDRWCLDRDQRDGARRLRASASYVPPEMNWRWRSGRQRESGGAIPCTAPSGCRRAVAGGLGAVPLRPLGLREALGVDLD